MNDEADEDARQKERRRRQAEELIAAALRERQRFRMQRALAKAAQAGSQAAVEATPSDGEE
jgi:hypothetical protein